jgi:hypothetical protein
MKSSPQSANAGKANFTNGKGAHIPGDLLEIGRADAAAALQQFESHLDGLTQAEAGEINWGLPSNLQMTTVR